LLFTHFKYFNTLSGDSVFALQDLRKTVLLQVYQNLNLWTSDVSHMIQKNNSELNGNRDTFKFGLSNRTATATTVTLIGF